MGEAKRRKLLDPNYGKKHKRSQLYDKIFSQVENKPNFLIIKGVVNYAVPYQIPNRYLAWSEIKRIAIIAILGYQESTIDKKGIAALVTSDNHKIDIIRWYADYDMALWFANKAPIYLVSENLLEAFKRTEILTKQELIKELKVSVPVFILLFPGDSIKSPSGIVDYVVIHFSSRSTLLHGEICEGLKISKLPQDDDFHIGWSCVDSNGTTWQSGVGITDGKLSGGVGIDDVFVDWYANIDKHKFFIGKYEDSDVSFLRLVQNLVLQSLLCLCFNPDLISDAEVSQKVSANGWAKSENSSQLHYLMPRWLGKNYQHQTARGSCTDREYHVAGWWRKGFWRNQPYGSRETPSYRPTWIEPTWCQPGE